MLSGGTGSANVVSNGGALAVSSGGTAVADQIRNGGTFAVSSGGVASSTGVLGQAVVLDGGVARGMIERVFS